MYLHSLRGLHCRSLIFCMYVFCYTGEVGKEGRGGGLDFRYDGPMLGQVLVSWNLSVSYCSCVVKVNF